MEYSENKMQLSRIEEAQGVIKRAPQRIEEEFSRSQNSWLECFGSSIFAIETYLDSDKVKAEIGEEKFKNVLQKLDDLKVKHAKFKEVYPNRSTIPPVEIRQELIEELNVLK